MARIGFGVGQIIRRRNHLGNPIGPYMRITKVKGEQVFAKMINSEEESMLLKDNVFVYPTTSLIVSDNLLARLKTKSVQFVQHTPSMHWNSVLHFPPTLIRFRSQKWGDDVTFVVASVKRTKSLGEDVIRIYIGNLIA